MKRFNLGKWVADWVGEIFFYLQLLLFVALVGVLVLIGHLVGEDLGDERDKCRKKAEPW